jgi:hypothetical protein
MLHAATMTFFYPNLRDESDDDDDGDGNNYQKDDGKITTMNRTLLEYDLFTKSKNGLLHAGTLAPTHLYSITLVNAFEKTPLTNTKYLHGALANILLQ